MAIEYVARPFFTPPTPELRYLPEGPRLLANVAGPNPQLGWISIQHGAESKTGSLNILDLVSLDNVAHDLPGRPGFIAEAAEPGVVFIGLERRLVFYDLASRTCIETGIEVTRDERVIVNDGVAVEGGLVFGTKDLAFAQEIAALYYFDTAGKRLCTLRDRQICSNGKYAYQREQQTLLADIDSPRKNVVLYETDLPACHVSQPKPIADFHQYPGVPDGMRPTPDGKSLVVCFYNPNPAEFGVARQVGIESGEVEAEWHLPGSPRVTCPEFVRLNGRVQIIFTTAIEGMPDEQRKDAPDAGCLFIADTGFADLPAPPPPVARF